MQRIHEDDEEQRSERAALTQAALHVEVTRHAVCSAHARRQPSEAVRHEVDERVGHAQTVHGAHQHVSLHGVVGLRDVVEERVQLTLARSAPCSHASSSSSMHLVMLPPWMKPR